MNEQQRILAESVARLLSTHAPPEAVRQATDGWVPGLWDRLAEHGLHRIGIREDRGGLGGSLADAHTVLWELGRQAAPVPVAESGILGGWALAESGLPLPEGPCTVVPDPDVSVPTATQVGHGWRLDGTVHGVPWAGRSERLVLLADFDDVAMVLSLPTAGLDVDDGLNLADEPRATVCLDGVVVGPSDAVPAPPTVTAGALRRRGALARVTMMAGAMERVAELCERYAGERHQFGRPIARFQAVQHHLVAVREEASRTSMAARSGVLSQERSMNGIAVAAAKVVAGDSSAVVAARAHQLHGAIGVTAEYDLQLLTRRLHAWRDEFGTPTYWAGHVANLVDARSSEGLWPLLTSTLSAEVVHPRS